MEERMQIKTKSSCDALSVARLKLPYCKKKEVIFQYDSSKLKFCLHLHEYYIKRMANTKDM